MSVVRGFVALCAATALGLAALFVVAAPASAYPVAVCGQLEVSTTTPHEGQSIRVSGTGFVAGDRLTLELDSAATVLGHVTVEADGTFSTFVTMPADAKGSHLIYAVGSTTSCPVDPQQLSISAGVAGVETSRAAAGSSAGSGGLASTGVKILAALLVGTALIGLGTVLTRGGRRERPVGRHTA